MINKFLFISFLFILYTKALDNGLARTPPMGWMSWTKFMCQTDCETHPYTCISEKLYMQMADILVQEGYVKSGYNTVHIDDCWMESQRDLNGRLVADRKRFPSGIAALANFMHSRGLKLGIYEDYGTRTCAGFPGSYLHEKVDAETFADWKVDYLKLDGCYIDTFLMPEGYARMGMFLNSTGRPIVYSCSWPAYLINHPEKIDYNLVGRTCNLWRNFDDISLSWNSIKSIIDYYDHNQDKFIPAQKPGQWHDPDMIIVGNREITPDQAKVQMSIWSIWSAPLIMSNDLRTIAPVFKRILLNPAVIAIDQDPLGIMGRLVANTTNIGVYVKPVTPCKGNHCSYAVAVFNRNLAQRMDVKVMLLKLGLTNPNGYSVEDLWSGQYKGIIYPNNTYHVVVNPTGVDFWKATVI